MVSCSSRRRIFGLIRRQSRCLPSGPPRSRHSRLQSRAPTWWASPRERALHPVEKDFEAHEPGLSATGPRPVQPYCQRRKLKSIPAVQKFVTERLDRSLFRSRLEPLTEPERNCLQGMASHGHGLTLETIVVRPCRGVSMQIVTKTVRTVILFGNCGDHCNGRHGSRGPSAGLSCSSARKGFPTRTCWTRRLTWWQRCSLEPAHPSETGIAAWLREFGNRREDQPAVRVR